MAEVAGVADDPDVGSSRDWLFADDRGGDKEVCDLNKMLVYTIEYGFGKTKKILADGYETSLLMDSVTLWRLENGEKKQVATFRGVNAIWGEDWGEEPTASEVAPVQHENFWDTHDPSGGDLPGEESELKEEKPKKQTYGDGKQVDYGKVWALRNAGWKAAAIAEEVNTSVSNVWRICAIMKEREKEV